MTEALVLQRRPLGEKDEIVVLISPTEGRFHAVARGSRRCSSSLVGRIEPFTHLQGQFARGRGELDHLTQARALRSFAGLRADLTRLAYGSYFLQLFRNCVPFRESMPRVFRLLLEGLEQLERGAGAAGLTRWLELRLAVELGYGPELTVCVGCGHQDVAAFSPTAGGLVCRACRASGSIGLSPAALGALRNLGRASAAAAARMKLDARACEQLEAALRAHLMEHWPSHLSAARVLRSLV